MRRPLTRKHVEQGRLRRKPGKGIGGIRPRHISEAGFYRSCQRRLMLRLWGWHNPSRRTP